jgi:3-phenylpropionate/trans-cinnamate dioxygenase ferredoxin subunit
MPFHRVADINEVPSGKMKRFVVDETPICVYNCGGVLSATHDTCSHAEASLADGFLDCETGSVECPLHGARFDVRSGKALSLPAVVAVKTYEVKVEGGAILVRL